MGMIRVNRPSLMVYGGSIKPGYVDKEEINIVDSFQSYAKYKSGAITEKERKNIVQNACPCSGSCGGMFTANTMAVCIESMGFMLPNSSSTPAMSYEKKKECKKVAFVLENLIKKDIKPSDIINQKSIENGIVTSIALGGSTNLVLHLLAIDPIPQALKSV